MKPQQTAELTNSIIKELIGEEMPLIAHDLSNIVDVGKQIEDVITVDNYVEALIAKIGKTIFDVEPYVPIGPNIRKESFEWGGIIEKIRFHNIEFKEDPKYNLHAGDPLPLAKYEPATADNVYYLNRDTSMLELTLPAKDREMKQYFRDGATYNNFITSIYEVVHTAISRRNDAVSMSTMNRMIADTLTSSNTIQTKVRLVTKYNRVYKPSEPLTADNALYTPEFLQFAAAEINKTYNDMRYTTKLFNINGRSTNMRGRENLTILKDFENYMKKVLLPDVYHTDFLSLPGYSTTPIWQGWGLDGTFRDKARVIMRVDGKDKEFNNIIAVAYDTDALGIYNEEIDSRTDINGPTGLVNLYYNLSISSYNDHDKNFMVFTLD